MSIVLTFCDENAPYFHYFILLLCALVLLDKQISYLTCWNFPFVSFCQFALLFCFSSSLVDASEWTTISSVSRPSFFNTACKTASSISMKVKYRLLQSPSKAMSVLEECYIKHVDNTWRELYWSPHSECLMTLWKTITKTKAQKYFTSWDRSKFQK